MARKAQKRPYIPRRPVFASAPEVTVSRAELPALDTHRAATYAAHQQELAHRYDYVKTELKRIAFTAASIVVLLVVLSFVIK